MEWLRHFKQDVGILPPDAHPKPIALTSWPLPVGGTDPLAHLPSIEFDLMLQTPNLTTPFATDDMATASQAGQLDPMRHETPTRTFGNPQLASGLTAYVRRELQKTGIFPSDAELQARARDIMSMQKTPADDHVLLGKFKASLQGPLSVATASIAVPAPAAPSVTAPGMQSGAVPVSELPDEEFQFPMDMDINFTEQELDSLVREMNSSAASGSPLSISPNTAVR